MMSDRARRDRKSPNGDDARPGHAKISPDFTRLFTAGDGLVPDLEEAAPQPLLQLPDDLTGKTLDELLREIRVAVPELPSATTNGFPAEAEVAGSEVEVSAGSSSGGFLPFLWGLLRQGGRPAERWSETRE